MINLNITTIIYTFILFKSLQLLGDFVFTTPVFYIKIK